MKKAMIVLLTIGLFTACNNNKAKTNADTKTTTKDDYRTNDTSGQNRTSTTDNSSKTNTDNTGDNSNTNNTSSNWTAVDVNSFVDTCVSTAEKGGMSATSAQSYCGCMQKKLEQKYPDTKDINNVDMESAEMKQLVQDCLHGNQ